MSVRWGLQAVGGQLDMLSRRTDLDKLLADPQTAPELRQKLQLAQSIRDFASTELDLPDNDSYRSYADLQRDAAVWNVIASAPYQLEPRHWCFLITGCLPYRGWFAEHNAWREAQRLHRKQQLDVIVSPATAYSTLGWFDDPLLNTMIDYPETQLAELLFHELAHQQLYIKGDGTFNESYATAVAEIGIQRWLQATGDSAAQQRHARFADIDTEMNNQIAGTRELLARSYRAPGSLEQHSQAKQAAIAGLRQYWLSHVLASKPDLVRRQGLMRWRYWFAQPLNNAHFVLHATYTLGVRRLLQLHACLNGELSAFYAATAAMADWDNERRSNWLEDTGNAALMTPADGEKLNSGCTVAVQRTRQALQ